MNNRDSLLYWSFPLGTWFWTRVRISVFFPLIILLFAFKFGLALGVVFGAVLFASVLLHEFGHIVAARQGGGSGDEILIWPLGGLAFVQPAHRLSAQIWTSAAGPFVNLIICGITIWPVLQLDKPGVVFNPLVFPLSELSQTHLLRDLLILIFTANYILFLVNLIPVYPLDGGQIGRTLLMARLGHETGREIYIRIGFLLAFIGMFAGLLADSTFLVFIGAIVLVLNMQESIQMRVSDNYDESFMGYDFSQGYTSLERSEPSVEAAPKRPSLLQRWRERRRLAREKREREREAAEQLQLDELLDKVHVHGIESLTDAEVRILNQASSRLRDKNESQD